MGGGERTRTLGKGAAYKKIEGDAQGFWRNCFRSAPASLGGRKFGVLRFWAADADP